MLWNPTDVSTRNKFVINCWRVKDPAPQNNSVLKPIQILDMIWPNFLKLHHREDSEEVANQAKVISLPRKIHQLSLPDSVCVSADWSWNGDIGGGCMRTTFEMRAEVPLRLCKRFNVLCKVQKPVNLLIAKNTDDMSYSFYDSFFAIHLFQYMLKENSLLRLNKQQKASFSLFKSLKIQILLDRIIEPLYCESLI